MRLRVSLAGYTVRHNHQQQQQQINSKQPPHPAVWLSGPSSASSLPISLPSPPCLPRLPLPPLLTMLKMRTPLLQAFHIGCCLECIPPSSLDFWLRHLTPNQNIL